MLPDAALMKLPVQDWHRLRLQLPSLVLQVATAGVQGSLQHQQLVGDVGIDVQQLRPEGQAPGSGSWRKQPWSAFNAPSAGCRQHASRVCVASLAMCNSSPPYWCRLHARAPASECAISTAGSSDSCSGVGISSWTGMRAGVPGFLLARVGEAGNQVLYEGAGRVWEDCGCGVVLARHALHEHLVCADDHANCLQVDHQGSLADQDGGRVGVGNLRPHRCLCVCVWPGASLRPHAGTSSCNVSSQPGGKLQNAAEWVMRKMCQL